jgi:hypothetical protein
MSFHFLVALVFLAICSHKKKEKALFFLCEERERVCFALRFLVPHPSQSGFFVSPDLEESIAPPSHK